MAAFVCSCDTACAGGPAIDCTILEGLASTEPGPKALASIACCVGPEQRGSVCEEQVIRRASPSARQARGTFGNKLVPSLALNSGHRDALGRGAMVTLRHALWC